MTLLTHKDLMANCGHFNISRPTKAIRLMVDWFSHSRTSKKMVCRVYSEDRYKVLLAESKEAKKRYQELEFGGNIIPFFTEFYEEGSTDHLEIVNRTIKEMLYFLSTYKGEEHISDWLIAQFGGSAGILPIDAAIESCPDVDRLANLKYLKEVGITQVADVSVFGEDYTEAMSLSLYGKLRTYLNETPPEEE